jgi:high-affinity iron transporter
MGTFVITLREGFEAALVVGLILAYLKKTDNLGQARSVWAGVAIAVVFSLAMGALLFLTIGELEGRAEQAYEGSAMILAAVVVTWMAFWMKKQARTIGSHLRERVSDSLRSGGGLALAAVAFIAVAREGLETGLFLFASTENSGPVLAISAALAGLAAAVGLGVAFYRGALRLDLRRFFLITGLLVIAFAAWLIYGGVHEFGELAGSELLETAAPLAAVGYALGLGWYYLRGVRPAGPPPAPVTPGASPSDA